jgi:S-adenosylmethionine synthetase
MMFGYASSETDNYMPLGIELAHSLLKELAEIRKEGKIMTYLRPDSKAQVTILYDDDHQPVKIDSIVLSTQHDEFVLPASDDTDAKRRAEKEMQEKIASDIRHHLIPRVIEKLPENLRALFNEGIVYHINPTGKFVIGGPHGDTGLTGRKIIVDTYGGRGAHGGGAFSGKDPSKVDRSAAYATRHIAKNMVAAGICDEALVQVAYAIGVADPMGLYVNTYGTSKVNMSDGEIAERIGTVFNMRPYAIEERLKLRNPIYRETAAYGHMGRTPELKTVKFESPDGTTKEMTVETFTWEKLDFVDRLKSEFGL